MGPAPRSRVPEMSRCSEQAVTSPRGHASEQGDTGWPLLKTNRGAQAGSEEEAWRSCRGWKMSTCPGTQSDLFLNIYAHAARMARDSGPDPTEGEAYVHTKMHTVSVGSFICN